MVLTENCSSTYIIVVPHFFCVFDFIQFIVYDQSNAYIFNCCNMSVSLDDLISVLGGG